MAEKVKTTRAPALFTMKHKYYIVYPSGDKSKLQVVDIYDYELEDYALASRQSFYEEQDAVDYAKDLAKKHNKEFLFNGPHYLD